jgi:hypothetical protein
VSAQERDEKFLDCAGRVLGSAGARRALDLAIGAGSLGKISELTRATVPAQNAARARRTEVSAVTAK